MLISRVLWKVSLVKETCCLLLQRRLEIWLTQHSWLSPPRGSLINELALYGMNRAHTTWIKSWLSDRCEKVVINGEIAGGRGCSGR